MGGRLGNLTEQEVGVQLRTDADEEREPYEESDRQCIYMYIYILYMTGTLNSQS